MELSEVRAQVERVARLSCVVGVSSQITRVSMRPPHEIRAAVDPHSGADDELDCGHRRTPYSAGNRQR